MRAGITTSCRSEGTRYTRLNLLGWALLCPHARDLLWHGVTPLEPHPYPTSEESRPLHDELKSIVAEEARKAIRDAGLRVVAVETEYSHQIGLAREDEWVCGVSKADIVYTVARGRRLYTLYVEVATRIHVAKPWQALLRGIALYYEWRLPTWVILVSPEEVRYKALEDRDQDRILAKLNLPSDDSSPRPDLCSLCELAHYCPYRVV